MSESYPPDVDMIDLTADDGDNLELANIAANDMKQYRPKMKLDGGLGKEAARNFQQSMISLTNSIVSCIKSDGVAIGFDDLRSPLKVLTEVTKRLVFDPKNRRGEYRLSEMMPSYHIYGMYDLIAAHTPPQEEQDQALMKRVLYLAEGIELEEDHQRMVNQVKESISDVDASFLKKNKNGIENLTRSLTSFTVKIEDVFKTNEVCFEAFFDETGLLDELEWIKSRISHASNYDIHPDDGFAPLWEEIMMPHINKFLIPKLTELENKGECVGDHLYELQRLMSDDDEFSGDSNQELVGAMLAGFDESELNGNRCRLALEHAMFVKWLRNRGEGYLYESFMLFLKGEYEAGRHYGTGGDLERADTFYRDHR